MLFPEGSRGDPETLGSLKKGIGHLACARPQVPIIPVFMNGLGKALPKGSTLLVSFNCTANVGDGTGTYNDFVTGLQDAMTKLAAEEKVPVWE